MREVHEGVCGTHIRGQALARKVARVGYYWPTTRVDKISDSGGRLFHKVNRSETGRHHFGR
ncbi:hypothetical protein CR513_28402, partial [Mucuna pruriens]